MERDENITNPETGYHFKERLVERVYKLRFTEKQMQDYIRVNNVELTLSCHEIWDKCQFLWQGILSDKFPQVNFYLWERTYQGKLERYIAVSDTGKRKMITIYPLELDLPGDIGPLLINKAIKGIEKTRAQTKRFSDQKSNFLGRKRQQLKRYESLAKKYAERASRIQQEIDATDAVFEANRIETAKYARILCNSLYFERDIMSGGIK